MLSARTTLRHLEYVIDHLTEIHEKQAQHQTQETMLARAYKA
ncbi:hypothetical protein [Helicobacter gastrofelis]|nr:hypothetical protein [Helicobacter sp. NHP19-012]